MRLRALLALVAAATTCGALAGQASAAVTVFFPRGEQLVAVNRPGTTVEDAVRALLRGPTAAERKAGFRTYIPRGTAVRSVSVAGKRATVNLGVKIMQGVRAEGLNARLAQVVYTATGVKPVTSAKVLIAGGDGARGVPRHRRQRAAHPRQPRHAEGPAPAAGRPEHRGGHPEVQALQQRLIDLGFLPAGTADGRLGPRTTAGVLAFQKWARLGRDGVAGPATQAALATAARPTPDHRGRPRPARRDPARPPGDAGDPGRPRAAGAARLERRGRHADAAGLLRGVRARRCGRGPCRSRCGCRTRPTSWAGSRSTSTRRFQRPGVPHRLRAGPAVRRTVAVRRFLLMGTPVRVLAPLVRRRPAVAALRRRADAGCRTSPDQSASRPRDAPDADRGLNLPSDGPRCAPVQAGRWTQHWASRSTSPRRSRASGGSRPSRWCRSSAPAPPGPGPGGMGHGARTGHDHGRGKDDDELSTPSSAADQGCCWACGAPAGPRR